MKTSPPTPLLGGEGGKLPQRASGKGVGGLGFTHSAFHNLADHKVGTLHATSLQVYYFFYVVN